MKQYFSHIHQLIKNQSPGLCSLFFLFIVWGSASAQNIPACVPANGLQGWWPFDGNANDESGNNNNGTVFGATLTYDRFGAANKAYSFNGTSDYISTNYPGILGSNPRAVSFWAQTADNTDEMTAVGWGDNLYYPDQGSRFNCMFNVSAQGITMDGGDCAITYVTPTNDGEEWHHYVFQFDVALLGQVQIYIDTVLVSQTDYLFRPTSALYTVNYFDVHFGEIVYMYPYYFNGQLDDIGIWNRALTQKEISDLYLGIVSGTQEISNEANSFSVYPNPAIDVVNLSFNKNIIMNESGAEIAVFNVMGEKVYSGPFDGKRKSIDVKFLSAGVYFVQIKNGNEILTQKIVKE